MIKRTFLVSLLFLFGIQAAMSCSCGGPNTFCQTASLNSRIDKQILKVVKLRDTLHGMVALVIDDYNNEVSSDTITVWGDNGLLCRVYTTNFELGDTLILNLIQFNASWPPLFEVEEVGDFELSICGLHYLKISGDKVIGRIAPGTDELGVDEFDELVISNDFVGKCLRTSVENESHQVDLEMYPNPAFDHLWVKSKKAINSALIFDSSGRVAVMEKITSAGSTRFDLVGLDPGVYMLVVVFRDGTRKSMKLIIG